MQTSQQDLLALKTALEKPGVGKNDTIWRRNSATEMTCRWSGFGSG